MVISTLADSTIRMQVTRGIPQEGVISPHTMELGEQWYPYDVLI